jgi:hypothetical protein
VTDSAGTSENGGPAIAQSDIRENVGPDAPRVHERLLSGPACKKMVEAQGTSTFGVGLPSVEHYAKTACETRLASS